MSTQEAPQTNEPLGKRWKKNRGILVELPSGNYARLIRSLNMDFALKAGRIPNPLRSIVEANMKAEPGDTKPAEDLVSNAEAIEQLAEFTKETVMECCVDPKIVDPPDEIDGVAVNKLTWVPDSDDEISWFQLGSEDINFIYLVAQGGATDLEAFREGQAKLLETVPRGEDVQVPPKRASKPRKPARKKA